MKIDGKFYPLQNSEWVKICKTLTKSQISVLYYLRSLDPYSNGMKIRASKIADDLGITKRAVNAAIAVLYEKGYINLEDIDYSVKVSAGGCLCDTEPTVTQVGTEFPTQEQNFPPENQDSHLRTEIPTWEQNFPLENRISHQKPETLVNQDAQDSKINKTYKTFTDSLSEEEREEFLKFGEQKAAQLPHPPTLPRRWVEANWKEIADQWYKSKGKTPPASKWETDPRTRDWIAIIEETGNPAAFALIDKERRDFVSWCYENKKFSWLKGES